MREDVRVIEVTVTGPIVDVGANVAKSMEPCYRFRYKRDAEYLTEDGRRIPVTLKDLTKPKLAQTIEREIRDAKEGSLFASFKDGLYTGRVYKYSLMMR